LCDSHTAAVARGTVPEDLEKSVTGGLTFHLVEGLGHCLDSPHESETGFDEKLKASLLVNGLTMGQECNR
jgi:hypothetical protein